MKKSFRQEDLKFLACMTMLIDHVGTVFFADLVILRIIGRLAFPLYGFLLVQGVRYSADKLHYGIRLGLALLIAEIPFDFVFYGGPTWGHQSVMVTLFLGYLMVLWMRHSNPVLPLVVCFVLAELAKCDYGGLGIAMIWMLGVTEKEKWCWTTRILGLLMIFSQMSSAVILIAGARIPIQYAGLGALLPMALYSGKKRWDSRWYQFLFYLFYPVHLGVLYWISLVV